MHSGRKRRKQGTTLFNYIWILWLVGMPIYFSLAYQMVRYRKTLVKKTFGPINAKRMIFQITTIGNMKIVRESIDNINRVCREAGYNNYSIHVVSEAKETFYGAVTSTVPRDYSTPNGAKHKARALHYAIEEREKNGENTRDVWVYHLDDESMITKQGLLSVLDHIDNDREPIAEGLITYPNKLDVGSKLVKYLDTVRPTFCYTCCAMLTSRKRPEWLHGSNLLIRADMEKNIGWDFPNTCAEDSMFGYEAHKKYGGIFGWHGGVLEEQSPFTFGDFIKQRQRWIKGTIENLGRLRTRDKVLPVYRMVSWFLGSVSFFTLIPALLIKQSYPLFLAPFFVLDTIILYSVYQIGMGMNFAKVGRKQRIFEHIKIFVVTPILWFLEAVPMALYFFKRETEFAVIKK